MNEKEKIMALRNWRKTFIFKDVQMSSERLALVWLLNIDFLNR